MKLEDFSLSAPGDNLDRQEGYINKVKLNSVYRGETHVQVLLAELQTDDRLEVCEGKSWVRMIMATLCLKRSHLLKRPLFNR